MEYFVWQYEKLNDFVIKKLGYDWWSNSEIEDQENYYKNRIKFVNKLDNKNFLEFRLKYEDYSVYIYNSKYKKGKTLFNHNFIKKMTSDISKEQKKVLNFMRKCEPSPSEFVLSIFSENISSRLY